MSDSTSSDFSSNLHDRIRDQSTVRRSDWITLLHYHLLDRTWDHYPDFLPRFEPKLSSVNEIILIQLSSIGDLSYTNPTVKALGRHYPKAHLSVICEQHCSTAIAGHPTIDQLYQLPTRRWIESLKDDRVDRVTRDIRDSLHEINKRPIDYVFNIHWSPLASILANLIESEAVNGPVLNKNLEPLLRGNPLFTHHIIAGDDGNPSNFVRSPSAHRLNVDAVDETQQFYTRHESTTEQTMDDLFSTKHNQDLDHVIFNTGSNMDDRRWSPDHASDLAKLLTAEGIEVGLIGGPQDEARLHQIEQSMDSTDHLIPWYRWTGSLLEDAYLAESSDVVVTTDSGPLHVISQRGVPCLDLVSSLWVGPWNDHSYAIQYSTNNIDDLPVDFIADFLKFMISGSSAPPKLDEVTTFGCRPGADSFWSRFFDQACHSPDKETFRGFIGTLGSYKLWSEQSREYGWDGIEMKPDRVVTVYEHYWSEKPPALDERPQLNDLTGVHLIEDKVLDRFQTTFDQWLEQIELI